MAEYIEREALIKDISESTEPFNTGSVFRAINRQPAADVAPVVHGRWIEKQEPIPWCEDDVEMFTVCSICGCHSVGESNYCPNCGARMDKERYYKKRRKNK